MINVATLKKHQHLCVPFFKFISCERKRVRPDGKRKLYTVTPIVDMLWSLGFMGFWHAWIHFWV